ncbi:MAG: phenylacetate--CoA ligase family protein [Candidatus Helarchaeota archaeon]
MEFLRDLRLFEKISGLKILEYYQYLVKSQWQSNAELKKLQNKKLRALIKFAFETIPYYHNTFKQLDLRPQDIRSIEDLPKLPILTKTDIQKNFAKMVDPNLSPKKYITNSTSGSTGKPFIFIIDHEMISWQCAAQLRAFKWGGYYPWDKYALLWAMLPGSSHPGILDLLQEKYNLILKLDCFNLTDAKFLQYYKQIIHFKPKILIAYPEPLYLFALYLKRNQLRIDSIRSVITNAEMVFPHQRKLIEETFQCPLFDVYGAREIALIIGECPEYHCKHISMETAVMELIRDGIQIEEDTEEPGEIIVTNLTNYAMPFIRYRVEDVATQKHNLCECGRGLSIINSLEGRINNMLITANGKYLPGIFIPALFAYYEIKGILEFQIIQKSYTDLEFLLVKAPTFQESELEKLISIIKKYMGNVNISIKFQNAIQPPPSGKRLYTISELDLKLY